MVGGGEGQENMAILRGQLKTAVTIFGNYLRSEKVDPVEEKSRREKIEDVWMEYEQVQMAMEAEEDIDLEVQYKYRTEFEDLYFKTLCSGENY